MMNPIDIIQESVKDYKLRIAQARRDEIRKLLDYYTGTETEKYIDDYFSADAFRYFFLNRFPIRQRELGVISR